MLRIKVNFLDTSNSSNEAHGYELVQQYFTCCSDPVNSSSVFHMFFPGARKHSVAVGLGMPTKCNVTARPSVFIVELAYIVPSVPHLSTGSSSIRLELVE
jgi:hypothetical protein